MADSEKEAVTGDLEANFLWVIFNLVGAGFFVSYAVWPEKLTIVVMLLGAPVIVIYALANIVWLMQAVKYGARNENWVGVWFWFGVMGIWVIAMTYLSTVKIPFDGP